MCRGTAPVLYDCPFVDPSPVPDQQLPRHVAISMEGNGRWAEGRGLSRSEGQAAGTGAVRAVVERCGELGIPWLTLYSFSSENWSRPSDEIDALMGLLIARLDEEVPDLVEKGVRLRHYGSRDRLSSSVLAALDGACEATATCERLTLGLAIDYGGREELARAARRCVEDGLKPAEVDEAAVATRLDTAGAPDPDLLIRTAGEHRLSNFLLWQVAYSELYVSDLCWPDFDKAAFDAALEAYAARERRFGGIESS